MPPGGERTRWGDRARSAWGDSLAWGDVRPCAFVFLRGCLTDRPRADGPLAKRAATEFVNAKTTGGGSGRFHVRFVQLGWIRLGALAAVQEGIYGLETAKNGRPQLLHSALDSVHGSTSRSVLFRGGLAHND